MAGPPDPATDTLDPAPPDQGDMAPSDTGAAAARSDRWRLLGIIAGVAGGYLAVRALGVFVVLSTMIDAGHRYPEHARLLTALTQWDAGFFLDIAEHGYGDPAGTRPDGTPAIRRIAFFPGYPSLIRVFADIPGLSYQAAALLVSTLAGVAAAIAVYFLVERFHGHTAAALAVVLWASQPMSIVLSMAYSEALFCALSFAALLAAQRQQWLIAGSLGFVAGVTRAQGLAVAGALVLCAAWWWWQNRRRPAGYAPGDGAAVDRWRGLGAVAATAIALLSPPLYIAAVGRRSGHLGAWFEQQEIGWGSRWDWGRSTPEQVWQTLTTTIEFYPTMSAVLVVLAVVLLGIAIAQRVWPGFIFFGVLTVAQTVGSSVYLQSKPRLLVPAITLLIPVAIALARARPLIRVLVLTPIVLFGLWFGATSITTWPYGI